MCGWGGASGYGPVSLWGCCVYVCVSVCACVCVCAGVLQTRPGVNLTREGSSGSGVRGEPSGVEGQLWSLALVTSPSARASKEGRPSSSTGMLSRVSVSTASKLASFSSSIFLGGGKGETGGKRDEKNRTL